MAEVWLAEDLRLERWVAVKILAESLQVTEEGDLTASIQREARTIANLQHPNIVAVYDTGEVDGRSYLVMEYVQGHTVRELLDAAGPMPESQAARYGQQIAAALHFAHRQGIVHCDVKPENILVNEQGVAKVADFGVADQVTKTLTPDQAREVLGTIAYLAPEVLQGQPATPASDIYSLGLTVYEMVAGRLPFSGATPALVAAQRLANPAPPLTSLVPEASPALEGVLGRALAIQPAERFATAEEFRQALVRAAQVGGRTTSRVPLMAPIAAPPPPPPPRTPTGRVGAYRQPEPSGSNAALIVAAVGAIVLAIGVGALVAALITGQGGESPAPTPTPTEDIDELTPTPEPDTPTPTPEPTLTPTPTPEPDTPTPEPTPTPTEEPPTPTPTPTEEIPTPTPEVNDGEAGFRLPLRIISR